MGFFDFLFKRNWLCPDCGDVNSGGRKICFRCGTDKLDARFTVKSLGHDDRPFEVERYDFRRDDDPNDPKQS